MFDIFIYLNYFLFESRKVRVLYYVINKGIK